MAIEFNCPHCTAQIRVPDAAAGKQGSCPQCSTDVLVPDVTAPDAEETIAWTDPQTAPQPPASPPPVTPPVPPAAPPQFDWNQQAPTPQAPVPLPQAPAFPPQQAPAAYQQPTVQQPPAGFTQSPAGYQQPPAGQPASPPGFSWDAAQPQPQPQMPPQQHPLSQPQAQLPPQPQPVVPNAPPPVWNQPPQPGFPDLGSDPVAAPQPQPAAPVNRAVARAKRGGRRRKRLLNFRVILPFLGATMLGGGLGWYFMQGRETLEGEIVGYSLDYAEVTPGLVKKSLVNDLPQETVSSVLEGLNNQPLIIPTGLIRMVLSKGSGGVLATVSPGEQTQWYRVKYPKALRQFQMDNTSQLMKPQEKEREKAALKFFKAWKLASDAEEPLEDLLGYRDSLGLNTTVEALGYHVMAIYEDTQYRCVAESDDSLFFLLPPGVKSFKIQGRTLANGKRHIDCNYTVTVRKEEASDGDAPDEDEPSDDPAKDDPADGKPKPDGDDKPSDDTDDDS